jgi:hypothetical protein
VLIEVRLFGDLRHRAGQGAASGTVVYLSAEAGGTVGQVFARVGIDLAEVGNVFLNGRLLPRAVYPMTLGYPLAAEQPLAGDDYLAVPVRSGDRVGIFPRNMSSVVV